MDLSGADYIKPRSGFSVTNSETVCPALSSLVQKQWQIVACPVGGDEDDEVMEQVR